MTRRKLQTETTRLASLTTLLLCLNSTTARLGTSQPLSRSLTSCYPEARKVRLESTTGQQIQMFEFQALSAGENMALNKTATQSSTLASNAASFAVDGNVTTFSHTNDVNAEWEVDLGGTISLESVFIKNRWCGNPSDTNGCLCRLSGATLSLLNEQGEVVSAQVIGNTCGAHDLSLDVSSCTPTTTTTSSSTSTQLITTTTVSPLTTTSATAVNDATTISPGFCYPYARKIKLESTTGAQIQMFEFEVMSPDDVNVALSKNASQSSTLGTRSASFAVDGDPMTYSHTNDISALWEVDLGMTSPLKSVYIANRWCSDPSDPNGCLCRLSGATLSLMNEQDELVSSTMIGNTCGVNDLNIDVSSCPQTSATTTEVPSSTSATTVNDATTVMSNSCYPDASKLKIESTTGKQIHMFELRVLSSGANIALNKDASQSSTLGNNTAFLAIDGDETTFSHTGNNDVNAVWEVDFGGTVPIHFVEVKNRWCKDPSDPNGCLCRLSGATLTLMNEQDGVVLTKTFGDTCGVTDLSFDMMSLCTPTDTDPTPSITISNAVITEDNSFAITFNNPLDETQIYAAVVSNSACTRDNSSFMVDAATENVSSGLSSVTLSKSIREMITAEDKNSGSVKLIFCLRADVLSPSFPSSLLASKVSAEITVTFLDSSSDFRIELQTTDFSDTVVDYTSQRNLDFSVALGSCLSQRNDGPYRIGSTLKFCVKSIDSDVVISGLNNVSFSDMNGNAILDIIDSNGVPSFVTSIAGLNSKLVDVATMMATTIYDQGYSGTTINVQGTVSVTYINAILPSSRRQLKRTEESPFAVQIVVGESTTEQTDSPNPNSATFLHRAMFSMTPALAAWLVLIFC